MERICNARILGRGNRRARGNRASRGSDWRIRGRRTSRSWWRGGYRGRYRGGNFAKAPGTRYYVYSFFALGRRIVCGGLLPQKIDRLAKARVLKLNSRDDDGVKFASNARCVAKICTDGVQYFRGSSPILTERLLPSLLHVRELAPARLVIRVFTVTILRIVDLFLPAPCGRVVRVERQDLFVFLESEIETP